MRSRLLANAIRLVAAALCVYVGLYLYWSHRYASAFANTRLGDSPDVVTRRFGAAPNVESPTSAYFIEFTMLPCSPPCAKRLWWGDPSGVFHRQAYYFEFDANRHLIRKTHYGHIDEAYIRWRDRSQQFSDTLRKRAPGVNWPPAGDAEGFRVAKVVVLARLLAQPQLNPRDPSWGPLSKFLVLRSWKGPFPAGATITAYTAALCFGPQCEPFPNQAGQSVVIFFADDSQPIYQMIQGRGGDEAHLKKETDELDVLAANMGHKSS